MITSLITGGAGFIGSHVARYCKLSGHQVIVIDDLSGGFEDNMPEGVIFINASICDLGILKEIFQNYQIHYVYHLAAYAAEGLSHFIRGYNYQNNLMGAINLINLSILHKIKCFVFTSSVAVYGTRKLPLKEWMAPKPEDPYGIAKYAVEMDILAANKMFGLNYIIFRPHNVYGEKQNIGDKYRNVIGIFMNQIMNHQDMTIFGNGEQTRPFSYIDDVAPIIANCINFKNAYNEIFNIGAENTYTVNFLANLVAREFGILPSIKYQPERKEVLHVSTDHSKTRKYFGETNLTSIEEGISKMARWAKFVGSRSSESFQNIEITLNLPSTWVI
jgi:UDP-glucose 4-epimerase